jgi:hypothetical protein
VGRLINKVTLSARARRQAKADRCKHSTAMAVPFQRRPAACPSRPAGLFEGIASRVAMLAKDWAIRGAPRLAGDALKQTECHLIYQTAHKGLCDTFVPPHDLPFIS